MPVLPTLFLNLAAPQATLPAPMFLEELGNSLPRPRAILVASPFWHTERPTITGAGALAERATDLLCSAGLASAIDPIRGLDPVSRAALSWIRARAEIPVAQISIQPALGPAHHLQIGSALSVLRREGALFIGAGSLIPAPEHCAAKAAAFATWIDEALRAGRRCDLLLYPSCAPASARNDPLGNSMLALFIALGAAGKTAWAERLSADGQASAPSIGSYAFRPARDNEAASGEPASGCR
jgi:4,5-DOPA dioxygenase extradiol